MWVESKIIWAFEAFLGNSCKEKEEEKKMVNTKR